MGTAIYIALQTQVVSYNNVGATEGGIISIIGIASYLTTESPASRYPFPAASFEQGLI